jgi:hypothetical protein
METTCLCDLTLCGQRHVTRADVSLFVTGLFMARQMTMGVSGRPAAWDLLHTASQI